MNSDIAAYRFNGSPVSLKNKLGFGGRK